MKNTYFEYNNNIFKVRGFDAYRESVKVTLIKQNNKNLCSNKEHSKWIEDGEMWPIEFFSKAKIIPNGKLLYEK